MQSEDKIRSYSDMKTSFMRQTSVASAVVITLILASVGRAADNRNVNKSPPDVAARPIDPNTGLPLPQPEPWKDPAWTDPDKILPEVVYDGIPLGEVARDLRANFKGAFDVLVPGGWQDPNNPAVTVDPWATAIKLQLKNVTASEVFNAMNLMFDLENTPYRWELKLNGNRPTAMLRILPQRLPVVAPTPPPEPQTRMVYFVGDLIGDEKHGGMTIEELVKTVYEVYEMSYGPAKSVLQFHKGAQLVIVTGTGDQINFVQQTLSALREKARTEHKPEPKAKTEELKPR
jgi:hypothetical protein